MVTMEINEYISATIINTINIGWNMELLGNPQTLESVSQMLDCKEHGIISTHFIFFY